MSNLGPCIGCGATDYASSYGGPSMCPACDCGVQANAPRSTEFVASDSADTARHGENIPASSLRVGEHNGGGYDMRHRAPMTLRECMDAEDSGASDLEQARALLRENKEVLEQCRKWIAAAMLERGWPQERVDDPPQGSHLFNAAAAIAAISAYLPGGTE